MEKIYVVKVVDHNRLSYDRTQLLYYSKKLELAEKCLLKKSNEMKEMFEKLDKRTVKTDRFDGIYGPWIYLYLFYDNTDKEPFQVFEFNIEPVLEYG